MQHITTLLLLLTANACLAQHKADPIYLDKNCRQVTTVDQAMYYRHIEESGARYVVRDYYVSNDTLEMVAPCSRITPELVYDGSVVWYYPNGKIKRESVYTDGKQSGIEKTFHPSGRDRSLVFHRDGKSYYCQYWLEDGSPVLVNGTGIVPEDGTGLDLFPIREMRDSLLIGAFRVEANADTVYLVVQQTCEYRGGMAAFYKGLSSTMMGKYPKEARQRGVQGKVFVQFMVTKAGKVENASVMKGIGAGCDEVALEAVVQQKNWLPAYHKGKPVNQMMVLPVTFKLN